MRLTAEPRRRKRLSSDGVPRAADLLAWYDRHRRRLPWRALPGEAPDPYRVWLSEIMLQQTTVKTVGPYFVRFTARWPDVFALAAAPLEDVLRFWAGLGYYARARNLHACARVVVERYRGHFPQAPAELATLPGIGSYTAAAIAAIAFDAPAAAVDGNVERVITRVFAVEEHLPASKGNVKALAEDLVPSERAGDFAQALMDLGATICTVKRPACVLCPWTASCAARARGDPETFPRKAPKIEVGLRYGASFVAERADGCVLVRNRPPHGLLGGMAEVPSTEWGNEFVERRALKEAPVKARWRRLPGVVEHGFTHFRLQQTVYFGRVAVHTVAPDGMRWVAHAALPSEAWPKVMRKVLAHAYPDLY